MGLAIKLLHGGSLQVEDAAGHWVIFGLDTLRTRSATLDAALVEGQPPLTGDQANLFVWAAFAAARGYALEHGLIADDRPAPVA